MTRLQQYKTAKDNGLVGFGDDTKPINIIPHPDRVDFVRIYYPVAQAAIDAATGEVKSNAEITFADYAPKRLKAETKPSLESERTSLKERLAEVEADLALIDEFTADIEPHVKGADDEDV